MRPNNADGALSTFPSSEDSFTILQSFDTTVNLEDQNPEALIQATHFNTYYDSIFNIETYLSNSQLGSITNSSGSPVTFASKSHTISITGTTYTSSFTLPSVIASLSGSSIGMFVSCYYNPPGGRVTGTWANTNWNFDPYLYMLQSQPLVQAYVTPSSASGSYDLKVVKQYLHPSPITPIRVTDLLLRPGMGSSTSTWESYGSFYPYWDTETFVFGFGGGGGFGSPLSVASYKFNGTWRKALRMRCRVESSYQAGVALANINECTNQALIFRRPTDIVGAVFSSTQPKFIGGPCLRYTGTLNNATFYGLAIGDNNDTTGSLWSNARIVKVVGNDLTNGSSAIVFPTWSGGGTVTELASGITMTSYEWWKFSITGSSIVLARSTASGGSWTTVASVGDATITGASLPGFFVKALNIGGNTEIRMDLQGPLIAESTDSYSETATVKILFMDTA